MPKLARHPDNCQSPSHRGSAKCPGSIPATDYLRVREHREWDKNSKEALYVRQLGRKTPQTYYELYREFVETRPPEVIANIALCLIHQANYLIDQQLRRLEKDFLEQGGLRERMTRARLAWRNGNQAINQTDGPPRIPWKTESSDVPASSPPRKCC
jgi:four helix bundle suffix protein